MTGGGGVGKTFLMKVISKWVEAIVRESGDHPEHPKCLLLAPTGVSAALIGKIFLNIHNKTRRKYCIIFSGGNTFHAGLQIYVTFKSLSDQKMDYFRKYLEDLRLIIIDEISMVGADKLYDINKRVQEIFIHYDAFGGVGTLFVGDLMQLNPVLSRRVFTQPSSYQNKALFFSKPDNLWDNCESVVLQTNHRQGDKIAWTETLNRIRMGRLTEEDKEVLETRRVKHFPEKDFRMAVHCYYTNLEVETWNSDRLSELVTPLLITQAIIESPEGYKPDIKPYGTIADSNMLIEFKFKAGAKVMLTQNICVADCLVNGVIGRVLKVLWNIRRGETPTVKAVVVKFDNPDVGEEQRARFASLDDSIRVDGGVPIFWHTLEFNISGRRANSKHGSTCKVTQIPLRLGWAFTAHKLQGVTLKKGTDLVCHGHKLMAKEKGMVYVMLSRCESLDNVFLDEELLLKYIMCDPYSLVATKRLEQLNIIPYIKQQKFDIFYLNIYSVREKMQDLLNDISPTQSDLICLTETWLYQNETLTWPNKSFHHASAGRGKGVCVFKPNNDGYEVVCCVTEEKYQMISITIKTEVPIQLYVLYISKDAPLGQVAKSIAHSYLPGFQKVVIGDFNFDQHHRNTLTSYLFGQGLTQIVKEPTYKSGSTIDHLYVPTRWKDSMNVVTQFLYYTDHASISVEFM